MVAKCRVPEVLSQESVDLVQNDVNDCGPSERSAVLVVVREILVNGRLKAPDTVSNVPRRIRRVGLCSMLAGRTQSSRQIDAATRTNELTTEEIERIMRDDNRLSA